MAMYDNAAKAKWNKQNKWDAALDFLRTKGLTQSQYSNLQGGDLPGHAHGMFLGMNPDMLKQIAGYVDAQGTHLPGTKTDPITGALIPGAMHFNYNDPRLQNGELADEQVSMAPWMGQGNGGGAGPAGGGQLPFRTVGGAGTGNQGRYPWTGRRAYGYGAGPGAPPWARAPHMPWQGGPGGRLGRTYNGPPRANPLLANPRAGSLRQQLIANAMSRSGV